MGRVTLAHIAIFSKDAEGFGFGAELLDGDMEVYHIWSLWLPHKEYPSQRQALFRLIPTILAEVPEQYSDVTFISTLNHFKLRQELIRKNIPFAGGKTIDFRRVPRIRHSAVSLAIDAAEPERRFSISERLID